jgi:hypothetical protein
LVERVSFARDSSPNPNQTTARRRMCGPEETAEEEEARLKKMDKKTVRRKPRGTLQSTLDLEVSTLSQ